MKAKELFHAQNGELKHKVRTVKDLIRFIETKENKDVSNYSIFLGAGASRSSGVSTAHELISVWMRELYERYQGEIFQTSDDKNYGNDHNELVRFFEKEHSSWFDASNAYSSLFERKFDLAPQRRRFVEQEVDGKLPSIGYAYLVSLVENNFFNAIFTTNFDDLLNEAFYQLSSTRPIVCAHDSSVHSISVSSKRPKIIKLHGDYLFENIKSTLRETESLEVNTKDKLIEFCKEYGLIVLGYSGNDRSIMDILDYLIKNDTYLRNGVYWCIRQDDEISPALKNLFWKERIYPVLIDGFDEFFSEVHHQLLPNTRFLNGYKESKQQKIIQKILENRESYNSEYITKDITYLEFESERQDFSYSLTEDLDMPDDMTKLKTTFRNTKKLIEIDKLASESVEDAYRMAKKALNEENSKYLKNKILQKLINFSLQLKEKDDYDKWVSLLIELDPYKLDFHKVRFENINNILERYTSALGLLDRFMNDSDYYNYIIGLGLDTFDSYKDCKSNDFLDEIDKNIEISLKLNPSLENIAWKHKIRLLLKKRSLIVDKSKINDINKTVYDFAQKAKRINSHDVNF
ncbi:SIR2 family protein [Psychrobacter sp. CMS30]|uniref:SIR2 family protein n=1 Tax=Psychrobacter sp. CMS30 TaxID=2774126 RepID=UPI001919345A|nr:SIR2 family protein [Psychrobacter sp. CMS30]